ncbi:DUF2484 family protein [Aliiruegeria sabulilitoris]|uniref:DUF2484 family protein n=1 Tax=Aliiruegeria sabulilitoris TaxID=1510458 RepID=UPI00082BDB79|nr:DUF2484 family protein [Aliiruegeria sabulilitoris]NDR56569.1 DUF2484 family protein [Pseudoruegeria sp. M32A2M]
MNVLVLGCLWVLLGAATAMLPLRYQTLPGLTLLLSAPWLVWQIGGDYGWLPLLLATVAVLSMFRKPLRYLALRVTGATRESARGRVLGERQ